MKILVGCPIKNRAFVFPAWVEHVRAAFEEIDVDPDFVFEYEESQDETLSMLMVFAHTPLPDLHKKYMHLDARRSWNYDRYVDMARVRNELLYQVRKAEPDYFLSLDSDILIAPGVLPNLLETMEKTGAAAVGGKLYMEPRNTNSPSYAMMTNYSDGLRRPDASGVFQVDVIMAMKLMSPAAYNVNYQPHTQGEDIGWCQRCTQDGLKLWWDGRITSKHIMEPKMLDFIDPRCGY